MLFALGRAKYYLLGIIVTNIFLIYFFQRDMVSKEQVYLQQTVTTLQSQYKATVNAYDLLSRYIFDQLNQDTALLKILRNAEGKDKTIHDRTRKELLWHLKPLFARMKRYHFSRFFFTVPDGSVFARLHKSYAYGDKASGADLNLELQKVTPSTRQNGDSGLFTYSEPLYASGVRVGSAHLSIAFDVFKSELTRLFPAFYQVVYTEAIANGALTDRKQFVSSNLGKAYYSDSKTDKSVKLQQLIETINAAVKTEVATRMQSETEAFSLAKKVQGQWFTVSFLPLFVSTQGSAKIGYLIAYTPDTAMEAFHLAFLFRIVLGNLILGMVLTLIYFLDRHARRFKTLATHDQLTGIHNRREFDRVVEEEFERSRRYERPISIILMDIDHFKSVNDTYGHQEGDIVLKGLADFIADNIRRHDFFARWGGEEFAILTTETTAAEAAHLAEKLRIKLVGEHFGKVGQITVSFGVAQINEKIDDITTLFHRADEALYSAKESGRNRVLVYGESDTIA